MYKYGVGGNNERKSRLAKDQQKKEPFIKDVHSVMNIGDVARARHFEFIIFQLNLFMWGTLFQPYELR